MKPAPFEYSVAATVEEALGLLGEDSRPLAGGQSLVPLLNFRLARPERLVDLNRLHELDYLRQDGERLRMGALTRQATVERSPLVAARWPLLAEAVRLVGHPAIRSRGTVGGSVAHADPTAELPLTFLALDARFHLRSPTAARTVEARDMFLGPLTTVLEADELLVEIELPPPPESAGTGFAEFARTHGDFAVAGAAAVAAPAGRAAVALLGADSVPLRCEEAERALGQQAPAPEVGELAAQLADGAHRRALLVELVRRAVERARS
jgi:aerobic carbon-monoxide dehydrogenase medium subunit